MPLGPDDLKALQRVEHAGLLRIPLFGALHLAATATVLELVERGVPWWACLPLHVLAAASLHGISLFTHEGVHGALSTHPLRGGPAGRLRRLPAPAVGARPQGRVL